MPRETKINVAQDENAPIQLEVLAASIVAVSEGVKKLRATAMKDDALYIANGRRGMLNK